MTKIKITERQYAFITEEYEQQNLFPDDKVSHDDEKKLEKDRRNKETRNAKARERYNAKKDKMKKDFEKAHMIARGTGEDLFGNKYSEDEKKSAEEFIQSHSRKNKKE